MNHIINEPLVNKLFSGAYTYNNHYYRSNNNVLEVQGKNINKHIHYGPRYPGRSF